MYSLGYFGKKFPVSVQLFNFFLILPLSLFPSLSLSLSYFLSLSFLSSLSYSLSFLSSLSIYTCISLFVSLSHSLFLYLSYSQFLSLPLISSLSLLLLHSYLFARLKSNNTKGEAVMLRAYAKKYFSEILIMLVRTLLRSDVLYCSRSYDYHMH